MGERTFKDVCWCANYMNTLIHPLCSGIGGPGWVGGGLPELCVGCEPERIAPSDTIRHQ